MVNGKYFKTKISFHLIMHSNWNKTKMEIESSHDNINLQMREISFENLLLLTQNHDDQTLISYRKLFHIDDFIWKNCHFRWNIFIKKTFSFENNLSPIIWTLSESFLEAEKTNFLVASKQFNQMDLKPSVVVFLLAIHFYTQDVCSKVCKFWILNCQLGLGTESAQPKFDV